MLPPVCCYHTVIYCIIYDYRCCRTIALVVDNIDCCVSAVVDGCAEDALPSDPGVTGLAVRDLLSQPLADAPHKATNQKRLAYTITVTSLQKVCVCTMVLYFTIYNKNLVRLSLVCLCCVCVCVCGFTNQEPSENNPQQLPVLRMVMSLNPIL
jgi:hypothetical protein